MRVPDDAELFRGLTSAQVSKLCALARFATIPKGEYVFLLGDPADRLYVVTEGRVELCYPFSLRDAVADVCVETVEPGRTIGWSALVRPYRFTLSARAREPSRLAAFRRVDLEEAFAKDPALGFGVMSCIAELMGSRVEELEALWVRALQLEVDGREAGVPDAEGVATTARPGA